MIAPRTASISAAAAASAAMISAAEEQEDAPDAEVAGRVGGVFQEVADPVQVLDDLVPDLAQLLGQRVGDRRRQRAGVGRALEPPVPEPVCVVDVARIQALGVVRERGRAVLVVGLVERVRDHRREVLGQVRPGVRDVVLGVDAPVEVEVVERVQLGEVEVVALDGAEVEDVLVVLARLVALRVRAVRAARDRVHVRVADGVGGDVRQVADRVQVQRRIRRRRVEQALGQLAGLAVVHGVEPPPLARRRHAVAVRVGDQVEQVELRHEALDRLHQRGRQRVHDGLHVAEELLQLGQRGGGGDDLVGGLVERRQRVQHGLRDQREQVALEALDEVVDVEVRLDEVVQRRGHVLRVEEQEVRPLAAEEEIRPVLLVAQQGLEIGVLAGRERRAESVGAADGGLEPLGDQVVQRGSRQDRPSHVVGWW